MEWMVMPLRRYAQFSGRARRKEFWMWVLFLVIVSAVAAAIDRALGFGTAPAGPPVGPGVGPAGGVGGGFSAGFAYGASSFRPGVLRTLVTLGTFLPNLAVQVRRLHDVNRRGWWLLLPFAPYIVGFLLMIAGAVARSMGTIALGGVLLLAGLVCAILLLVWFCTDGTRGPNRFGEDPKGAGADLTAVFG